ncbi:hypothetical protein [Thalassotalea marina]|uniref:Uncharacterized protein n=1 Tax=Thalassotalea marina TaxID=1673741 RepID=A0A919ELD6_9GAMM|nr:hypothetical protein [Thalassotalea marina]GHF99131.1 hypothetical protein GCM10017161_29380 [Thalassotalea marina]
MELAINEIKLQAKKLHKRLKSGEMITAKIEKQLTRLNTNLTELKLKHCLTIVSQQLGFVHWHQAHQFFSGISENNTPLNWGTYLYPEQNDVFINEWFADYSQAKIVLEKHPQIKWLLPYKQQFIVVEKDFIDRFKLDPQATELWRFINHDLKASYNSKAWDHVTAAILKQRFLNVT